MAHTVGKERIRKAKKSYTLSADSVAFLELMRKKRHASSVSSVLEEILQKTRREEGLAAVEHAVADYYASLSREDAQEQTNWGDFAMREFPNEGV